MSAATDNWVIDTFQFDECGVLAFCPIDDDGRVAIGLSVVADSPPGHFQGVYVKGAKSEADVQKWIDEHKPLIDRLLAEREDES